MWSGVLHANNVSTNRRLTMLTEIVSHDEADFDFLMQWVRWHDQY
jgi:hypothetical protein